MPDFVIWSAPEERYEDHVSLCIQAWKNIEYRMLPTLSRLFDQEENTTWRLVEMTIVCHDIGKLTNPWQIYIHKPKAERKYGPPHATLGAPYLHSLFDKEVDNLKNAGAVAILMHHVDSGIARGNLEHPAEDAINRGLVEYGTDGFRWADGAEDAFSKSLKYAPQMKPIAKPLTSITLHSLEDIAKRLRLWARCPKEIERHQHRLQALALHHILKVCDWRAAAQRPTATPDEDEDGEVIKEEKWARSIQSVHLDGGLLP